MSQRLLSDLKVPELRVELERRGADRSGRKPVLIERLKKIILEEGKDPLTYNFTCDRTLDMTSIDSAENPTTQSSGSEVVVEVENTTVPEAAFTNVSEGSIGTVDVADLDDKTKEKPIEQSEETADFVVRVGDDEDDLDYDISDTPASAHEEPKMTEAHVDDKADSKAEVKKNEATMEASPSIELNSKTGPSADQVYLRVSNLKMPTKAVDLKKLFNPHGKVLSAKILASTRTPGCCVGFLKMASLEGANACIRELDGADFNGSSIQVGVTDNVPQSVSNAPKSVSNSSKSKLPKPTMSPKRQQRSGGLDEGMPTFSSVKHGRAPALLGRRRFATQVSRSIQKAHRIIHGASAKAAVRYRPREVEVKRFPRVDDNTTRRPLKVHSSRVHEFEGSPTRRHYTPSGPSRFPRSGREEFFEKRHSVSSQVRRDEPPRAVGPPRHEARYRSRSPVERVSQPRKFIKPLAYRRERNVAAQPYSTEHRGFYHPKSRKGFERTGEESNSRYRPPEAEYRPRPQPRGDERYQSYTRRDKPEREHYWSRRPDIELSPKRAVPRSRSSYHERPGDRGGRSRSPLRPPTSTPPVRYPESNYYRPTPNGLEKTYSSQRPRPTNFRASQLPSFSQPASGRTGLLSVDYYEDNYKNTERVPRLMNSEENSLSASRSSNSAWRSSASRPKRYNAESGRFANGGRNGGGGRDAEGYSASYGTGRQRRY